MKSRLAKITALAAVVALAAVPAAIGKHGESHGKKNGNGNGKGNPVVTYMLKGTFNADDTVATTKGNKHSRRADLVGTTVAFDFSDAKLKVADTDGNGTADIDDVQDGDSVLVKTRMSKKDPEDQPLPAKMLIDKTNPPVDEDEAEEETEPEAGNGE